MYRNVLGITVFRISAFKSNLFTLGLCCVFSSRDTFNYIETYLERTVGKSDDVLREDVPIVLVLAQDPQEKDSQKELKSKAQELVIR